MAHAGSGKSHHGGLAKKIRENVKESRVPIITDRTELDEQIEKVFLGVSERFTAPSRAKIAAWPDRPAAWNPVEPAPMCSLVQSSAAKKTQRKTGRRRPQGFVAELKKSPPKDFRPRATCSCSWTSATAPSRAPCTRR